MDLQVTYIPIDSLQEYENNARKHGDEDVEAIVASIREFGFLDPIGVWSDDNVIVEGHGRLLAARELGMTEVPCIRLDELTDEQRRAYALAHNRTAELSSWDKTLQTVELININDIDMSQFGFEDLTKEKDGKEWPEVEFTEVLGEESNYVVLKFTTDVDWAYAETVLGIKPVMAGSTRKDGKISKGMRRIGVGRVLDGVETLRRIMGDK